jgi:hypothetical protein
MIRLTVVSVFFQSLKHSYKSVVDGLISYTEMPKYANQTTLPKTNPTMYSHFRLLEVKSKQRATLQNTVNGLLHNKEWVVGDTAKKVRVSHEEPSSIIFYLYNMLDFYTLIIVSCMAPSKLWLLTWKFVL